MKIDDNCNFTATDVQEGLRHELCQRKKDLWKVVKPLLTSRKNDNGMFLCGRVRYLTTPLFDLDKKQFLAVMVFWTIEGIERAKKSEDIESAVVWAASYGEFDSALRHIELFGVDAVAATSYMIRTKRKRAATRKGKRELKGVPDILLQMYFTRHHGKRDWLKQLTEDLISHRGEEISSKTVRDELRIRGIVE